MSSLISFINSSPTSFHAADSLADFFLKAGFTELHEKETWTLKKEHSYFLRKDGTCLAFHIPKKKPSEMKIAAAHTDSPGLKLKPNPEIRRGNALLLASEVYGAPLLSSWLNRDLKIAGKILYADKKKTLHEALVDLDDVLLTIPQLAIHLDRNVNEQGPALNKQEHLNALAAINFKNTSFLDTVFKKKIISHDLFLVPAEKARFTGYDKAFISGARLDNLASVFAIAESLIKAKNFSWGVFWDHEEIGSNTHLGAASPLFERIVERACLSLGYSREEFLMLLSNSSTLSIDLAHAMHPNYAEKQDPNHPIKLGAGPVLKWNANVKYATSVSSSKFLHEAALKKGVPLQNFVSKNDMPCGSTIGPVHAAKTGINTCDLGIAQLSMHSIRELIATQDYDSLKTVVGEFFSFRFANSPLSH